MTIDSAGIRAWLSEYILASLAAAFLVNSELMFAFSRMFATFRGFEGNIR